MNLEADMNRRDAMKATAGLALGAGVLTGTEAIGQEAKKAADQLLETALKDPYVFMFAEEVTFKTSVTEPYTFNLVITSARDPRNGGETVEVRPGSMRIFRADADKDEFTRKGGVYWRCGKTEGKFQFKEPGALVMAVRDQDGTVRCYSLAIDARC